MLSNKSIKYFQENGYSFEEIEGIKIGLRELKKGDVISKNEMNNFVNQELFAKYKANV